MRSCVSRKISGILLCCLGRLFPLTSAVGYRRSRSRMARSPPSITWQTLLESPNFIAFLHVTFKVAVFVLVLAKRHSLSRLSELFLEALRRPSFDSTNSTVGLTACRQHARQVALACEEILPNLSLTSSGAAISGMALAGHANAIASGAGLTKG